MTNFTFSEIANGDADDDDSPLMVSHACVLMHLRDHNLFPGDFANDFPDAPEYSAREFCLWLGY